MIPFDIQYMIKYSTQFLRKKMTSSDGYIVELCFALLLLSSAVSYSGLSIQPGELFYIVGPLVFLVMQSFKLHFQVG